MGLNFQTLAVIVARGGSKRIPRKNARSFRGRPMVAWPVTHAGNSNLFSQIAISTDDQEIADIAVAAGASMYGLRPEALSNDYATTADVLLHELQGFKQREGVFPELCCCLYGTSALAFPDALRQGMKTLLDSGAEMCMAVIPYGHPIERALQIDDSGLAHYRQPEFALTRTQDIRPSYHDSGLLYWLRPDAFLRHGGKSFAPLRKAVIIVSPRQVVDIDTEEDWEFAEMLAERHGLQ